MALLAGADDAGSTMMEENVVSASGTYKLDSTEVELQSAIVRAGFTPIRRNSDYHHLPTELVVPTTADLSAPPPNIMS